MTRFTSILLGMLVVLSSIGCGVPTMPLSKEQRHADMEWVFSVFENNYAPLEYKQERFKFSYADHKTDCLKRAEEIPLSKDSTTNDTFRALVYECVTKFQDAHTGAAQMGTLTAGKGRVAYLGFLTSRVRVDLAKLPKSKEEAATVDANEQKENPPPQVVDALQVKDFLLTQDADLYEVKKGDYILSVNGVGVRDYLKKEIVPFKSTGQEESSLNSAGESFPLRSSFVLPVPQDSDISLTLRRGAKTLDVKMPWIKRDFYEFRKEILAALELKKATDQAKDPKQKSSSESDDEDAKVQNMTMGSVYQSLFNGVSIQGSDFFKEIEQIFGKYIAWKQLANAWYRTQMSFTHFEINPAVYLAKQSLRSANAAEKPTKLAPKDRPFDALADLKAKDGVIPVYLIKRDQGLIGYIRIPTFEIKDPQVKEIQAAIANLQKYNVAGIVVDLLDNGGGSLGHGFKVARMFAQKEIEYPFLQVRMNDNWLDSFGSLAEDAPSDAIKESARRIRVQLQEDMDANKRLSRPISAKEVFRGDFAKEPELRLDSKVKLVVLVNENCASMCDIFAAVVRDNKMGTLIGSRTMGAGGNVNVFGTSPSSHFILRQTESLVLGLNGEYIENNGVVPEVTVDTVLDRSEEFKETFEQAYKAIFPGT